MKLLFPEDARRWLAQRYERQRHEWLTGAGSWPLGLALGDPTEKQVIEDVALVRAWSDAWRSWTPSQEVHWEPRHWPRLGQQQVPARLQLASPDRIAELAADLLRHQRSQERYARFAQRWSSLQPTAAWRRHLDIITDYSEEDYERLFQLLLWIEQHPVSDHYLRELPIPGLDTKWIDGKRQSLITDLLRLIRGRTSGADFHAECGLRRPPKRIRMRLLCPELQRSLGGLSDIEAPLDEIAALPLAPERAIIVENLETGLALPQLRDCVAFMKLGHSVSLLGSVPWLQHPVDILYWGDLDTHGFACLHHARSVLPQTRSILMDEPTLLAHRKLWGQESSPYAKQLLNLTASEQQTFQDLRNHTWSHALRLEQERIPWAHALSELHHATE